MARDRSRSDIVSVRAELQEVGIYEPPPSSDGIAAGAGSFVISEKVPAPPRAFLVAYSNVETRETMVGVEMVATCPSCLRGTAFTWARRPTVSAEQLAVEHLLNYVAELEQRARRAEDRAAIAEGRYLGARALIVENWSANEAWLEWLLERGTFSWLDYFRVTHV